MQCEDDKEAVDALMDCNHHPIEKADTRESASLLPGRY